MGNLRSTNLNLLPILRELLRKRNVTRAAEALNMSQPAVSEALGRLRGIFHDEILIQSGRTLMLTAFAERLMPKLEASLGEIDALIFPQEFNPKKFQGRIKIATGDYVVLVIGAALSTRLGQEAPGLCVSFLEYTPDTNMAIRHGQIDFAIVPSGTHSIALAEFERQPLFEDEMVYVVNDDSDAEPASREDFLARPHVSYHGGGDLTSSFSESVQRQSGLKQDDVITVRNFMLLPFVLRRGSVALVQRRLAERLAPAARCRIVPVPVELPRLEIVAAWSKARGLDPVHSWFRQLLMDLAH